MAHDEEIIRFSVSLPQRLLAELDRKVTGKGYASRSELVRDLIREKIVERQWEKTQGDVLGILSLVYDHHLPQLTQKLIDIQHHHLIKVICSTHVHLDHHNCLEAIIIEGHPPEIERITTEISGLRGVKFAKLIRASKLEL